MPSISDMPAEIIIKISRSLTTQELGNLRLTNKRTEAATFLPFAREFFFKKQFMFTEFSLQTLIDIAEHPQLGPQLSHLVLGLDGYVVDHSHNYSHAVHAQGPEVQIAELITRRTAQKCLLDSGVARDMLAHAFKRLSGLQTVGIRDFCSNTRDRDRGAWRSYGSVTASEVTGRPMIMRCHTDPRATTAFPIVIQALAGAQRTGVGLEVILRSRGEGLTDSAFALHSFSRHQTLPVVKSLRKLHLDILLSTIETMSFFDGADNRDNELDSWLHTSHLQIFLSQASSLEWLRLNMKRGDPQQPRHMLSWIALPLSKPAPVPGHFVAPLKRLDLGDVTASRTLYWAVVKKFKDTLEALSLWNATITISQAHYEDRIDQWTQLFKQLAGLPHLKGVTFGRLRVCPDYPVAGSPYGASLGLGAAGDEQEVHCHGEGVADFLQQMANRAQLNWDLLKPMPSYAAPMDNDEDEDNDSDEDSSDEFNGSDDDDAMDEDA